MDHQKLFEGGRDLYLFIYKYLWIINVGWWTVQNEFKGENEKKKKTGGDDVPPRNKRHDSQNTQRSLLPKFVCTVFGRLKDDLI